MAAKTTIEWCDATWNPVTGCTPVSSGCKNCYALRQAKRLKAMGQAKYANGAEPTCHPDALNEPAKWKLPQRIFVCSMADLLHEEVSNGFLLDVFAHMVPPHTYMILTKRADRLYDFAYRHPHLWRPEIWTGVTIESRDVLNRLGFLRRAPVPMRFVSFEPLLESIPDLDLTDIDWVIVGAETGQGARRMNPAWARDIRDQCKAADVPFFFKKMSGGDKTPIPKDLAIRQFPREHKETKDEQEKDAN